MEFSLPLIGKAAGHDPSLAGFALVAPGLAAGFVADGVAAAPAVAESFAGEDAPVVTVRVDLYVSCPGQAVSTRAMAAFSAEVTDREYFAFTLIWRAT